MKEAWFFYDPATGAIIERSKGEFGDAARQQRPDGWVCVVVPEAIWDDAEPSLEPMRAAVWERVKALRDGVIAGGAMTPIGVVQADLESRTNLNGAVLLAMLAKAAGEPFQITWIDLANEPHQIDANGMIAIGQAAGIYVAEAHARAQALRIDIDATDDLHALLTIPVTSGWPNTTGEA